MSRSRNRVKPNRRGVGGTPRLKRRGRSASFARHPGRAQRIHGFLNPSTVRQARYDPAVDVNRNGLVARNDGVRLLRSLPPIGPRTPMFLRVAVAPQDAARNPHPTNSGGTTHSRTPTVVGRTTPGALIFTGNRHRPTCFCKAPPTSPTLKAGSRSR